MINKISLNVKKNILTIVLFVCASLFMNNFYKSTLGFIANNFEGGLTLITIILNYILPVLCFIVYFINYYIKPLNRVANAIYSVLVVLLASFSLYGIFSNIGLYASNNALGVYQALPSIILLFPYDGIIVNIVLILVQVFNLLLVFNPQHKLAYLKDQLYSLDKFNIRWFELPIILVVGIWSLFSLGDFVCGLNSIANALYDIKYLFLLIWVGLIPLMNLTGLLFKFENRIESKKNRILYLLSIICANALFIGLFFMFETIYPNFVVGVGKPLFPITYSISLPIEIMILIGVQVLSTVVCLIKVLITATKNYISEGV